MISGIFKWYFLLNKRLLKKCSFLLILCLVPILTAGVNILSQENHGIVRIVLCMQNPQDELAAGIIDELMDKDSVLNYILCEDEKKAEKLVKDYEADAAWIFSPNFKAGLQRAASDKKCEAVVRVVEREDSVSLQFTRQILVSKIYSDFSYMIYENFVRDDMGLTEVSDIQLKEAYETMFVEGSLFQMEYLDGQREEKADYNYLLTPLRGILSVWFVLCGFASSMYFMQDEQNGVLARIALNKRLWAAFSIHIVVLSDAAVMLLMACRLSGVFISWREEVLRIILLTGCTMLFCNLVRLLCRIPERLGVCIPVLLMGMLVVCPIFVNLRSFKVLPYLLPPYYYLKSIHSVYYVYGMMVYILVLFVLCILVFQWQNKNMRYTSYGESSGLS